jgi:hypothetical protein
MPKAACSRATAPSSLGPNPSNHFGPMSFCAVMGALGMKLVAVEDAEALAGVNSRLVKRLVAPRQPRPAQPRAEKSPVKIRRCGRWGGRYAQRRCAQGRRFDRHARR